jgi:hypothetical protein
VKLADYSPATSPSLDQQRDALHKGLGRAMQWAMAGRLDGGLLLDACLHDKRYDAQVNDSRGDWLWGLMQAVHAEDRFRTPLLDALSTPVADDAEQLCELGLHYALTGDRAFRTCLYRVVENEPVSTMPGLGEEQLVQLDGVRGFLFAVRHRGQRLKGHELDWYDVHLIEEAIERLGEDQIFKSLDIATDEATRRFRDAWFKYKIERSSRKPIPHSERMQQTPISEIIFNAESANTGIGLFRGWGKYASEQNLESIRRQLLAAKTPSVIVKYLRVFSNREYLPLVPDLIVLCGHCDDEVRRRAFAALEKNSHPVVRQFAEDALRNGVCDRSVVSLFIKNYQEGDEQRILKYIELPSDELQLHWLLMDVTDILEENPKADCSQLGTLVYALTPCGNCRYSAAKVLCNRNVAPPWLAEECRFDSEEDTRKLFTESSEAK